MNFNYSCGQFLMIFLASFLILGISNGQAQTPSPQKNNQAPTTQGNPGGVANNQPESPQPDVSRVFRQEYPPFEELTEIRNPFDMRDPFLPPHAYRERPDELKQDSDVVDYSDQELDQRALSNLPDIGKIKIIGLMVDGRNNAALVEINKRNIILREGMRVGKKGGKIIAIREKGLVYNEKQENVYRKEESVQRILQLVSPTEQRIYTRIVDPNEPD